MTNLLSPIFRRDERYRSLEDEISRYRRIFKGSQNYGFVDWDLRTNSMVWHGGYWQSLGYSEKEISKLVDPNNFTDFIHPDDRELLRQTVISQLKKDIIHAGAMFRIRKKQGGYIWTEIRVETERDETGWAIHLSGIVFDVTQLKQTEEALLESEARHARIIQSSSDGIWEWNALENLFSFSSRCWEQIGFTEKDWHNGVVSKNFRHWKDRMDPDDRARMNAAIESHILEKTPYDLVYRIKGKEGDWRWIRSRGQMTYNEKGEPLLMSGTNMDITQLKVAEKRVLEAKESAEKANKAKSEFLSAMSHELRTPLNAILGFAQLFELDHNLTEDQRDNILEIKNAGRHLLKLIGDVLDLTKIEAGRTEFTSEKIPPLRVIHSCLRLLKNQAENRNIQIFVNERSFEDFVIFVDGMRFKQVMLNLISNSIKYNKKDGQVKIYCDVSNTGMMKISVEDTGKGIPIEYQSELFQPFNRLGAEKSNIEGSGVGLLITKELTEHMGGEISYKTAEGIGTTFWVCFPVCQENKKSDDEEMSPDEKDIAQLNIKQEKTILYVEDNPSNQRLMEQLLAKFSKLHLNIVGDALQGLYAARLQHPDLIVLDINLPGMNGFEMVEILKQDFSTQDIPVIALTANALAIDIEKGKEVGFDHYLTKPIDIAKFIDICNDLLI